MKRRQPPDTYIDTMLWIADGRRSWNRKLKKPRPAGYGTGLHRSGAPGKHPPLAEHRTAP
jgi:hypothetical protein